MLDPTTTIGTSFQRICARSLSIQGLGRAVVLALGFMCGSQALQADDAVQPQSKPVASVHNIVLVHGAFVDASIWTDVATILIADGYSVGCVQLPLTNLADDAHATRQVLAHMRGPTILVGYSWGGVPVTQVGIDPKVKGLVYFAAVTPKVGQSLREMLAPYPPELTAGNAAVYEEEGGALWLKSELFAFALAHDSPVARTTIMAISQKPTSKQIFDERPTEAAWRHKPSWYVISTEDHIFPVDLQRKLAVDIGATTFELPTGHASILSHPRESAAIIEQAAQKVSLTVNAD